MDEAERIVCAAEGHRVGEQDDTGWARCDCGAVTKAAVVDADGGVYVWTGYSTTLYPDVDVQDD